MAGVAGGLKTAPSRKQRALLVVNKAQFGTAVWLNGKKVGEHLGCFTAGRFDLTDAIHWKGDNQILIRIGAHPGALPPTVTVTASTDCLPLPAVTTS